MFIYGRRLNQFGFQPPSPPPRLSCTEARRLIHFQCSHTSLLTHPSSQEGKLMGILPYSHTSTCIVDPQRSLYLCPNLQTLVFVKTSPKRSYSVIENERFGLVFLKTVSIISGTVVSLIFIERNFRVRLNQNKSGSTGWISAKEHNPNMCKSKMCLFNIQLHA